MTSTTTRSVVQANPTAFTAARPAWVTLVCSENRLGDSYPFLRMEYYLTSRRAPRGFAGRELKTRSLPDELRMKPKELPVKRTTLLTALVVLMAALVVG